jgi:hypothetical protein
MPATASASPADAPPPSLKRDRDASTPPATNPPTAAAPGGGKPRARLDGVTGAPAREARAASEPPALNTQCPPSSAASWALSDAEIQAARRLVAEMWAYAGPGASQLHANEGAFRNALIRDASRPPGSDAADNLSTASVLLAALRIDSRTPHTDGELLFTLREATRHLTPPKDVPRQAAHLWRILWSSFHSYKKSPDRNLVLGPFWRSARPPDPRLRPPASVTSTSSPPSVSPPTRSTGPIVAPTSSARARIGPDHGSGRPTSREEGDLLEPPHQGSAPEDSDDDDAVLRELNPDSADEEATPSPWPSMGGLPVPSADCTTSASVAPSDAPFPPTASTPAPTLERAAAHREESCGVAPAATLGPHPSDPGGEPGAPSLGE